MRYNISSHTGIELMMYSALCGYAQVESADWFCRTGTKELDAGGYQQRYEQTVKKRVGPKNPTLFFLR